MPLPFYCTYIILGITLLFSLIGFNNRDIVNRYLFIPYNVKHHREFYRFLTHPFLHADIGHLAFNCIAMYYFGQSLETFFTWKYGITLGEIYFVVFVLLSIFASSSISYFRHQDNPGYRSLGLSGVTSAVVFAMILLAPNMKIGIILLPVQMPAWIFGILYLAFEIYSDRNKRTNIAHDAHIAGAIFGVVFILITNIDQVITAFKSISL